jgi:hypothetical protein
MNKYWWRLPLVRELALILLVKLALIFAIYRFFFAAPVISTAMDESAVLEQMNRQLGIPVAAGNKSSAGAAAVSTSTLSTSTLSTSTTSTTSRLEEHHDQ